MQEKGTLDNHTTPLYNRGRRFYHIGSYSFVAIMLLSVVFTYLPDTDAAETARNILISLLGLVVFIAVPVGLIYIIKSMRSKEPANKYRWYYFAALLFIQICLLIMLAFILLALFSPM
ncbi:hypothetical protein [Mucilaginibacter pedocola]|uniref:Uncharacterized protein n=1 Tax=Mucilaginibacter pedocola TaxID=1792845 RepID=A0A1S9PLD2_9SPHI|nr:hypothetical protein [Mucilaginibacter pedocola]OOQ61780.1 hypothetical protein BC343_01545 [Mucilaginibacter pedocola]